MGKTAMVSLEILQCEEIVRSLEDAGLKLNVALWANLPEYSAWRLVFAARRLDLMSILDAFGFVRDLLAAAGYTYRAIPDFMVLKMNDPFIKALRRDYSKFKNVEGMRIYTSVIGDRSLQEAYVYRLS